jgi:hypothetical protein
MNVTNNIWIHTFQHISPIINDTSKIIDQLTIIQFRLLLVISSQSKGLNNPNENTISDKRYILFVINTNESIIIYQIIPPIRNNRYMKKYRHLIDAK